MIRIPSQRNGGERGDNATLEIGRHGNTVWDRLAC